MLILSQITSSEVFLALLIVTNGFETSLDSLELHFDDFSVAAEEDFSSQCSVGGTVKITVVISDDTSSESGASDECETPCNNNARDSGIQKYI